MNRPPTDGIRVPADALRQAVARLLAAVPVPAADAQQIAELLVDTDLRGVVSHGVLQVERYVQAFREGRTNPDPRVRVLSEGPATAALAGDGGLGIVVGVRAMELAMAKAAQVGVGVVTTTYHDHIGSAGKYVRMAMRRGFIGICFSGRSAAPAYDPSGSVHGSIQGSPPLAFGMPAAPGRPYFLLDMSSAMPWDEACFARMPEVYYRGLGLCHVANLMSGTLGGQMLPEFDRRTTRHRSADQSGLFMALDVARFVPLAAFAADVDHLLAATGAMRPYPGNCRAYLPGGPEFEREAAYARDGVPVSAEALAGLGRAAALVGVDLPWQVAP